MYNSICSVLAEKASNHIHFFRSGGGLRVGRLERDNQLVGYGESYEFLSALILLEEDVKAGGRRYEDVYGKLAPQYLTGVSEPSSNIDHWLLMGRSFDIRDRHFGTGDTYELTSEFTHSLDFRKYYIEAEKTDKPIYIEKDGVCYKFQKDIIYGGSLGSVVENKSGLDPWFRKQIIEFRSNSFQNILKKADDIFSYWLEKNEKNS